MMKLFALCNFGMASGRRASINHWQNTGTPPAYQAVDESESLSEGEDAEIVGRSEIQFITGYADKEGGETGYVEEDAAKAAAAKAAGESAAPDAEALEALKRHLAEQLIKQQWGQKKLVNLGPNAHTLGKLNQCQGDCDTNSHCASGLICHQRDAFEHVPGCGIGGTGDVSHYDYCGTASTPEPTEAPTPDPTEAPTPDPTEAPKPDPTEMELVNLGPNAHTLGKLNQCQGDCDTNSHCASGLICHQRNAFEPVPGCGIGGTGDVGAYDYCGTMELVNLGSDAHTLGKLKQCQGDCDTNSHCASGFICYQRNAFEPVPGCGIGGTGDVGAYDYCITA